MNTTRTLYFALLLTFAGTTPLVPARAAAPPPANQNQAAPVDNGSHHQTLKGAAAGAVVGHFAGHHALAGALAGGTIGAIKKHHDKKMARKRARAAARRAE